MEDQRLEIKRLVAEKSISNRLISAIGDVPTARVSEYLYGCSLNHSTTTKVEQAVKEIAAFLEKFGPVKIDMSDPDLIKRLMRADQEIVFSILLDVLVGCSFYFAGFQPDKSVLETRFLLAATRMPYKTANEILQQVHDHGYSDASIVMNPYNVQSETDSSAA